MLGQLPCILQMLHRQCLWNNTCLLKRNKVFLLEHHVTPVYAHICHSNKHWRTLKWISPHPLHELLSSLIHWPRAWPGVILTGAPQGHSQLLQKKGFLRDGPNGLLLFQSPAMSSLAATLKPYCKTRFKAPRDMQSIVSWLITATKNMPALLHGPQQLFKGS